MTLEKHRYRLTGYFSLKFFIAISRCSGKNMSSSSSSAMNCPEAFFIPVFLAAASPLFFPWRYIFNPRIRNLSIKSRNIFSTIINNYNFEILMVWFKILFSASFSISGRLKVGTITETKAKKSGLIGSFYPIVSGMI